MGTSYTTSKLTFQAPSTCSIFSSYFVTTLYSIHLSSSIQIQTAKKQLCAFGRFIPTFHNSVVLLRNPFWYSSIYYMFIVCTKSNIRCSMYYYTIKLYILYIYIYNFVVLVQIHERIHQPHDVCGYSRPQAT